MKNFHAEHRFSLTDRIGFISLRNGELEIGYGTHAILIGKWFIIGNWQ